MNFSDIKNNRIFSFIVITVIYVLGIILGVLLYRSLNYDPWISLLISDVLVTVFVFIFSLVFRNASVYDPYWSVQPIVIVSILAIKNELTISRLIVLIVILFWGIRLTMNWVYTFPNLNKQDWRYSLLKEKSQKLYPLINFIGIHLVPTLVVFFCVLPVLFLFKEENTFNIGTILFALVSLGSVILQGTADIQMHKFRKNKKGLIREGVWKYSRHPNYLAEIMMWWGIGLYVVCSLQNRFYLLFGALFNTCLFLFISIPLAEGHQSHKDGFQEYKKNTRMLLPIKK